MKTSEHKMRKASGFTLIEIMITILVLAIVLGVGVPSLVTTIRNNRLASASNELVSSLNFARNEATLRRIQISICTRDGDACATGAAANDWSQGWLIFTDDLAPAGQIDAPTDVVLMSSTAGETGVAMDGDGSSITFTPQGALNASTVRVTKAGCQGQNTRVISVQATGRISLLKEEC